MKPYRYSVSKLRYAFMLLKSATKIYNHITEIREITSYHRNKRDCKSATKIYYLKTKNELVNLIYYSTSLIYAIWRILRKHTILNHDYDEFESVYKSVSFRGPHQYIKVSVLGVLNSDPIKLPLFIKNKNINKKKNKVIIVYLPKYTAINIINVKNNDIINKRQRLYKLCFLNFSFSS